MLCIPTHSRKSIKVRDSEFGEGVNMPNFYWTFVDLQEFFNHLPDLLSGPEARFSFFNGLGATSESLSPSLTRVLVSTILLA